MFFRRAWPTRTLIMILLVLAYFFVFPSDLDRVLNTVLEPVRAVLSLSHSIAPGLYAVIAVAILAWTAMRIWGSLRRGTTLP